MAVILNRLGMNRRAQRLRLCFDGRGFPCREAYLCPWCERIEARKKAQESAARAVLAIAAHPRTILFFGTFTVGQHQDFAFQWKLLNTLRRLLNEAPNGSWSKLEGTLWWIEHAKSLDGRSRTHAHSILAFDADDLPRHMRQIPRTWANRLAHQLHPDASGAALVAHVDAYSRHQDIRPLHCYGSEADVLAFPPSFQPANSLAAIARDVENTCLYAKGFKRIPTRLHQASMTPEDRVAIALAGARRTELLGIFRGIDLAAVKGIAGLLRAHSPSTPEESKMRALNDRLTEAAGRWTKGAQDQETSRASESGAATPAPDAGAV